MPRRASATSAIKKRYAAERRFRAYGIVAIAFGLFFLALLFGTDRVEGLHRLLPDRDPPADRPSSSRSSIRRHRRQATTEGADDGQLSAPAPRTPCAAAARRRSGRQGRADAKPQALRVARRARPAARERDGRSCADRPDARRSGSSPTADVDSLGQGPVRPHASTRADAPDQRPAARLDRASCRTPAISSSASTRASSPTAHRAEPETAGVGVALVGSFYMMLIVLLLSLPIGVAAAIYLEEFAPQEPLDRPDRGQHQQPGGRAVDRVRPARPGGVPQLLRPAALGAAGRRPGADADDAADHHHRHAARR